MGLQKGHAKEEMAEGAVRRAPFLESFRALATRHEGDRFVLGWVRLDGEGLEERGARGWREACKDACVRTLRRSLPPGSAIEKSQGSVTVFFAPASSFDQGRMMASLRQALPIPFPSSEGRHGPCRLSVGLHAPAEPRCVDARSLAFAGLAALCASREEGQACRWLDDSLLADGRTVRLVEELIAKAVDERQLVFRLQPVFVCAREGALAGAEALVRWRCPGFGEVPPSLFLPAVDRLSLTERIDLHVLSEVCAFQRRRFDVGARTVPVAVNLSRDDLVLRHDFVDRALRIVDAGRLPHSLVRFELVEDDRAVGEWLDFRYRAMKSQIDRLRAQGFKVLIDDYGTGMSNVKTLSSVPFDLLKIDKSLVDRCEDPTLSSMLRHLIACMSDLGREVIAEGVEDERHARLLEDMGCGYLQGFYRSRPLSVADFADLLDGRQASS